MQYLDEEEQPDEEREYVFLHPSTKINWKTVLFGSYKIRHAEAWKILVVASIIIHVFIITFVFVFWRYDTHDLAQAVVYLCDAVFIMNHIFALVQYFRKDGENIHSKYRLILDFVLTGILQIYIYKIFGDHNKSTLFFLRSSQFVRLYYLVEYFRDKQTDAGLNHWKYFLTYYLLSLMILHHFVACFWCVCGRSLSLNTRGWAKARELPPEIYTSPWHMYENCVYYAMVVITARGYHTQWPTTSHERILSILANLFGIAYSTGVYMGPMVTDHVKRVRRRAKLRVQLANINKYLSGIHQMDRKTRNEINIYYNTLWKQKKGVVDSDGLSLLPFPLRTEICFDINIQPLLNTLTFRDKPEYFLRTIAYKMKHEFYPAGMMIFHQGVVKNKMIFVVMGTVQILSEEDNQSPIVTFGPGSALGGASLITTLPAKASVKAGTYTELQVMNREDFVQIINLYPEIYQSIFLHIYGRVKEAKIQRSKQKDTSNIISMSLFVSQYQNRTPIKILKDKLTGVQQEDQWDKCVIYKLADDVVSKKRVPLCMTESFPWIMHPESSLAKIWEVIIVLDALLIFILYPYCVSFLREFPRWLETASIFFDFILVVDVFVILCTAVIKKDKVVTSFFGIFQIRLTQPSSYFEVLSCVHIELFSYAITDPSSRNRVYYLLKLNRLLKIFRIFRFLSKLENDIQLPEIMIASFKYILMLVMWLLFVGPLLYIITCFDVICASDGWFFKKLRTDMQLRYRQPCSSNPISLSYYFAISTIVGATAGDVYVRTPQEFCLIFVVVILSILINGYCISRLSAANTLRLRSRDDFQGFLDSTQTFLIDKNVRRSIRERIYKYFVLQWDHNEGIALSEYTLFYNASKKIQADVLLKERMDKLLKIPMFQDTNLDFVQLIVVGAKTLVLPPKEYITYIGAVIPELFIIEEGNCVQFDTNGKSKILRPGDHFGTAAILNSSPCLSTIETLTHVKLLSISEELFRSATSMFPSIKSLFHEVIHETTLTTSFMELTAVTGNVGKKIVPEKYVSLAETELKGSFVNVYKYCKRHHEDYFEPFTKIGHLSYFRYTLVPICILPNGLFLKLWTTFRILAAVIIAFLIPYQMTLAPHTPVLDRCLYALDYVAYVDLYIMLLVGYYGKKNQLIFHPLRTANHYLQGKAVLDLFLSLPYEILLHFISPSHNEGHTKRAHVISHHHYHCLVRTVRILQVYRLSQAKEYICSIIHKKRAIWVVLVYFCILTLLAINLWAGIIVRVSCVYLHIDDVDPENLIIISGHPYFKSAIHTPHRLEEYTMVCRRDSWIDKTKFSTLKHGGTVYIYALFFCTDFILGVGFGMFSAQYEQILILVMIVICVSFFAFMFIYANILSYRVTLYSTLARNQEKAVELKKFLVQQHVNSKLQNDIYEYFEYLWKRTRGAEPHVVLSHLHSALHEDTVLDMYARIFKDVPLFEGVDNTFFALLGQAVHESYFLRGYTIFRADDVVDQVYIIFRGKIELISNVDHTVTYMGAGGLFGNFTTHHRRKIKVTTVASTNVDVLSVRSDAFYNIVQKYHVVDKNVKEAWKTGLDYIVPFAMETEIREAESGTEIHSDTAVAAISRMSLSNTSGTDQGSKSSARSRSTLGTGNLYYSRQHKYLPLYLFFLPHKWCRIAILPTDKIYETINFLAIVLAYVNCIQALYQYAFRYSINIYEHITLIIVLDIIFLLKKFLELHKAYENHYGDYVTDNRKIIAKFFEHRWKTALELIANCPLYYLSFVFGKLFSLDGNVVFATLRLVTFLRCMYIIDFFVEKSNQLMVHRTYLKLGSLFVLYSLIVHGMACLLFIFACPDGVCTEDVWENALKGRGTIESYVICLYIMVDLFTMTANCRQKPTRIVDVVVALIFLLFCKFALGFFMADVANVVSLADAALNNYEYDITELRDYLENENLSEFQMEKMWNYLRHLWRRDSGKQVPRWLEQMPSSLKIDVMMDIYGHHLRNSYIFSGTEESFIRQLSAHLERIVFFPGNYVVQHGDSNLSMYFIHTGKIDILTVHPNLTETIHEVLVAGDMFGLNQGIFHGVPHVFSYRARTVCDIVRLYLPKWEELMNFFPVSKNLVYKRAHDVYRKI